LQLSDTSCNTLHHAATRCNTLQHAATHCKLIQAALLQARERKKERSGGGRERRGEGERGEWGKGGRD